MLLLVLGLAGHARHLRRRGYRSGTSRASIPSTITGQQVPVFPLLFTTSPGIPGISGQSFPSFAGLVALLGPVLGIAFGFDAISSERSEGTLPRLVSQPIHRDDVINGKFVAGLAVITMILGAVIVMLAGVGIIRLGIVPDGDIVLRVARPGSWWRPCTSPSGWRWPRSRPWCSGVRRPRHSWSSPSGWC